MVTAQLNTMTMDHYQLLCFVQINRTERKKTFRTGIAVQVVIRTQKRSLSICIILNATLQAVFMLPLPILSVVLTESFLMSRDHTLTLDPTNYMNLHLRLYLDGIIF